MLDALLDRLRVRPADEDEERFVTQLLGADRDGELGPFRGLHGVPLQLLLTDDQMVAASHIASRANVRLAEYLTAVAQLRVNERLKEERP